MTIRRVPATIVAAGCLAGALALLAPPDGAGANGAAGPTSTAQERALRVTASEGGSLARADTTTVVYDGTGGTVGGGPAGSGGELPVQGASTGEATVADIQLLVAQTCEPTTTSSSSSTSTSTSTSTTTPSTTSTTEPCPTTTTTPPTTAPPITAPPMQEPPLEEPPLEEPPSDQGGRLPTGDLGNGDTRDGTTPETSSGDPSATLTALLPIGETAGRGSVLYRADDEPIVALLSADPLFRDLSVGVDDGPDVAALEANLVELGYGSGLTVDEELDAATATAVKAWEEDLGRGAPDGVVTVGEVVLLDEPTSVLGHEAQVGDLLESGDAVLVLGAESRVIETDVVAEDVAEWPVGTTVELDWGDGTTATGTVTEVSRDEAGGEVDLVITIGEGGGADRPIGSAVEVVRTVAERSAAVAVPVAAVVDGPEGPSVRVVGGGDDRLVPVELGIVADGWVEVTSGLDAGAEVRRPGS